MEKLQLKKWLEQIQNSLAIFIHFLKMDEKYKTEIKAMILLLSILYKVNCIVKFACQEEFINETGSSILNMRFISEQYYRKSKNSNKVKEPDFIFLDYPWMFSTAAKVDVVQNESKLIQNDEMIGQMLGGDGLFGLGHLNLRIDVHRDNLLEDALNQLSSKSRQLKMPLKVTFVGEQGIDEGGVRKEFFHLLMDELFNPNYAMFLEKNVIIILKHRIDMYGSITLVLSAILTLN